MDSKPPSDVRFGTCGWSYDGWRGHFYPQNLPAVERLEHYSRFFNSVEVDSTFYSAPTPQVAGQWLDATPENFLFAAKVPREITHERKLRRCEELLAEFLGSIAPLHRKLACVLLQLPPYFAQKHDEQALRDFVQQLPSDFRFAIEFRDPSWHLPRIVHLLEEHRLCWVWNDITPYEKSREAAFGFLPRTTDFLYLRLLGDFESSAAHESVGGGAFELAHPRDAAIESWAIKVEQQLPAVVRALIYSTNQFEGFATVTMQQVAKHFRVNIDLPTTEQLQGASTEGKQQLDLL